MVIVLSDIIEYGFKFHPLSPCSVVINPTGKTTKVLTYRGAWQAYQDHSVLLQKLWMRILRREGNDDIVIAYLSSASSLFMIFPLCGER